MFFYATAGAQDVVVLKDGTEIQSQIVKVSENDSIVYYKNWIDLESPTDSVPFADVYQLLYEDGSTRTITDVYEATEEEKTATRIQLHRKKLHMSAYQTIVVDTIGKMMDFIITYKCGTRQPQIRDWGGINAEFSWMTRTLSSLNKNVVFVAHRDTRKEGDDTVFIPALREKSYNSIVTELDLLGYLEMKNKNGVQRRTITFDPTSRNDGKNTCNFPGIMFVPGIVDAAGNPTAKNNFITTQVIAPYLNMLAVKKAQQEQYDKLIAELRDNIELITDAQSANDFIARIDNFEHIGSSKAMASKMLADKARALNLVLGKDKKYGPAA